jgi:hypothetical protein
MRPWLAGTNAIRPTETTRVHIGGAAVAWSLAARAQQPVHSECENAVAELYYPTPVICIEECTMKQRAKRTKAKSSSTRARTKSKSKRTNATKKSVLPKVKRVAKNAALAAGVADRHCSF